MDREYNKQMAELIKAVCEAYEDAEINLSGLADEFGMTKLKVRKLLITGGVFHSDISDEVNSLYALGRTVPEIMKITGLGRASVHSYLPYTKAVYNTDELSMYAKRCRKYRERKAAREEYAGKFMEEADRMRNSILPEQSEREIITVSEELKEGLWNLLLMHEGYVFYTLKGLKFTYRIKGYEMFISRKDKSVTKSSIGLTLDVAMKKAVCGEAVTGPKKLGTFGASYLYPIFMRFGLIFGQQ